MWNARALHKLCFPQRGWEQKAHTHIEKETTRAHTHTQKHTQRSGRWKETRKRGVDRERTEREGDRELMNLEQHTDKNENILKAFLRRARGFASGQKKLKHE